MKKIYNILLALIIMAIPNRSLAQTARLFSSTGLLKGTYTKIADALAASEDKDSIVLSAHTFYENDITNGIGPTGSKTNILQGTISGKDTTIINANGNLYAIRSFRGTLRDMVITGVKVIDDGGTLRGLPLFDFGGVLAGNITIRDNVTTGNVIYNQHTKVVLEGNIRITNNTIESKSYPKQTIFYLTVSPDGLMELKGKLFIAGNKGGGIGGVIIGGDASKFKKDSINVYSENLHIENNEGSLVGGIKVLNGVYADLTGVTIINNRFSDPHGAAAVLVEGTYAGSIPYDSVAVPYVHIRNSRIYNPLPDGSRQAEVRLQSRSTSTKPKPCYFYSEGCWWGNSDTTGLFKMDTGTHFKMDNWAVAHWYGVPFGSVGSQVRAQMQLNTGAPLPPNCFKGLTGHFASPAGSFPKATSLIDSGNLIASDYYYPSTGTIDVIASVDADTFRTKDKSALGIKEPGYTDVKVYPNPTTDELHISNLPAGITLHIYDATGRIIMQRAYTEAQPNLTLQVSYLPAGVYTIKLYNQQEQEGTVKFVKK